MSMQLVGTAKRVAARSDTVEQFWHLIRQVADHHDTLVDRLAEYHLSLGDVVSMAHQVAEALPVSKDRRNWSEDVTNPIRSLIIRGVTPDRIAEGFGLELEDVNNYIRQAQLSAGDGADIVGLHYEGLTAAEIAAQLEVPRTRVYNALKRAGCQPNRKLSKRLSARDIDEIRNLREEGLSYSRIAAAVNATPAQVRRVVAP